jgi:hypothetical protein
MRYDLKPGPIFSVGVVAHDMQVRMGKGKGSFDHWASRIAVSKVIFELKGDIHEQVARDAFRLAGNKMPGRLWWSLFVSSGRTDLCPRPIRIREERRSPCSWNYKIGWYYDGRTEETSKKDSLRVDTSWINS